MAKLGNVVPAGHRTQRRCPFCNGAWPLRFQSTLRNLDPDPWIAVSTIVVLANVAAAAGMIPAHRASLIEPILALRFE